MSIEKLVGDLKVIFAALDPEKINAALAQIENEIDKEAEYVARLREIHAMLEFMAKRFEMKTVVEMDSRQDGA